MRHKGLIFVVALAVGTLFVTAASGPLILLLRQLYDVKLPTPASITDGAVLVYNLAGKYWTNGVSTGGAGGSLFTLAATNLGTGTVVDFASKPVQIRTLTGNTTLTSLNESSNVFLQLITKEDATGGYLLSFSFTGPIIFVNATNQSSTPPAMATNANYICRWDVYNVEGTNLVAGPYTVDSKVLTDLANSLVITNLTSVGTTLGGTTTNSSTVNGGTYAGATFSGTATNSGTINGGTYVAPTLSGSSVNSGTVSGGTYAAPTFSGTATATGTLLVTGSGANAMDGLTVTNGVVQPNVTVTLASDATTTSATLANLSLTTTLAAGSTYAFDAYLFASDSVAADGAKIDFGGGAATATTFRAHVTSFDSALNLSTQLTSLTGAATMTTLTGSSMIEVHGTFKVNGAGTFIPRFAQSAHTTGTLTVFAGSNVRLTLMP